MIGTCQRCGEERALRKGVLCHSCDQSFLSRRKRLRVVYGPFTEAHRQHLSESSRKKPPVSLPVVRLP